MRSIGVFAACLFAANFAVLATLFIPTLFDEIMRTRIAELASGVMFLSLFSLPVTLMGGLTFGLGFLALARSLSLSQSVASMTAVGALAGGLYSLLVMMFLGGLRESIFLVCFAGSVGGAVAGMIWTVFHERHSCD